MKRTLCSAVLIAAVCGAASADEVQVSTTSMQDVEFDHTDAVLQFVDSSNQLWAGHVNTTTGAFVPSSGEGTLVDTSVAMAQTFGNGPEWVQSTAGYSLIYTKFRAGTAPSASASTAYLAKAKMNDSTGTNWTVAPMPNSAGFVEPEGNLNPTQSDPPVVFHSGTATGPDATQLSVQGINDGRSVLVPNSDNTDGSARFVTGMNELVYTAPVTNSSGTSVRQVFSYDIGTGITTQLTFDATNKGDAFMIQPPEYSGQYVLMTSLNGQSVAFYTYQYNSKQQARVWTQVAVINTQAGEPGYVHSPEPFFYNNKTYIYMVRSISPNPATLSIPTQIWVASMDGSYNVQVSDPNTRNVVRSDPKYYATSSGVYIYYLRYSQATSSVQAQPQGVWRSNSGIPLQ